MSRHVFASNTCSQARRAVPRRKALFLGGGGGGGGGWHRGRPLLVAAGSRERPPGGTAGGGGRTCPRLIARIDGAAKQKIALAAIVCGVGASAVPTERK